MTLSEILETLYKNGAKLEVREGKLKVNVSATVMTPEIHSFIKDNKNEFLDFIKQSSDLQRAQIANNYPLSSIQRQFYFLNQLDKKSLAYNLQHFFEIQGNLDKVKLESAFCQLIERHEILRSTYQLVEGNIRQQIQETFFFELKYKKVVSDELESILQSFIRPFDLEKGPMIRASIFGLSETKNVLVIDFPHIVTDGISGSIIMNELAALYNGESLLAPIFQYKDFATWQQSKPYRLAGIGHKEFWLNEFKDGIPNVELPTDFKRVNNRSKGILTFEISREKSLRLKELARSERTTMFNLLFAIFGLFISKLSSEEDIVIGTPTAGRVSPNLESMVGVFLNVLPIRLRCDAKVSFQEYLRQVSDKVVACLTHQGFPFDDLVNELGIERQVNQNPIFNTIFNFENFETPDFEMAGLKVKAMPNNNDTPGFDLNLIAVENQDSLFFKFVYDASLFKRETVELFATYLDRIAQAVIENQTEPIATMELLSSPERKQLLEDFNQNEKVFPQSTVIELFKAQVKTSPDLVAVEHPFASSFYASFGKERMSYKELDERSNHLANCLVNSGVTPGDMIPIVLNGSLNFIIGMLGVLKAGAAFVPIDNEYPKNRITYILEDIKPSIVITETESQRKIECKDFVDMIFLDTDKYMSHSGGDLEIVVPPEAMAYVMYTSGTTGMPKGVIINHRALHNYICCTVGSYVNGKLSNFPLFTSISFDLTITSIFTPLVSGNAVVIYNESEMAIRLENILSEGAVQVVKLTPSHLMMAKELIDNSDSFKVDRFILGGERLDGALCAEIRERFGDHIDFYNEYGPTECTVGCTLYKFKEEDKNTTVPIGKPFHNMMCYVLNSSMQPVPVGFVGELYMSGNQVSEGYLNKPQKTADSFVRNPFDARRPLLYRTGDMVKWLPDGNLLFMGRNDHQVKIRGHRIELGEIENVLLGMDKVTHAAAFVKIVQGSRVLAIAYTSALELDKEQLKEHFASYFPPAIIPNFYIRLEDIPLTINGKVDRKALQGLDLVGNQGAYEAPTSDIEIGLSQIWGEILGMEGDGISIDANFFDLGGHSLSAVSLSNKIAKRFNIEVAVKDIFEKPTVAGLSALIAAQQWLQEKHIDNKETNKIII